VNNASVEHSLNDLIEIARDGQSFYEEAASKVQDTELSSLFRRIAAVKADIVGTLGTRCRRRWHPGRARHRGRLDAPDVRQAARHLR
jgi:conserved hypothetical protein